MSRSFDSQTPDTDARPDADALLRAGLTASHANDAHRALELFARASAACPASGVPHFLASSEYAELGQIDEAEAELAKAVLLEPAFHLARYQLGLLQFSSGRAAAGLATWRPLLQLDDAQALKHFVCGFAALGQDDLDGARSHFEDGLARNTDNLELSADIWQILLALGEAQGQGSAPRTTPESDYAAAHALVSCYGEYATLH